MFIQILVAFFTIFSAAALHIDSVMMNQKQELSMNDKGSSECNQLMKAVTDKKKRGIETVNTDDHIGLCDCLNFNEASTHKRIFFLRDKNFNSCYYDTSVGKCRMAVDPSKKDLAGTQKSNYCSDPPRPPRIVVVGGGPAGLLSAIQAKTLGLEQVVVVEMRDVYSRLNMVKIPKFSKGDESVDSVEAPKDSPLMTLMTHTNINQEGGPILVSHLEKVASDYAQGELGIVKIRAQGICTCDTNFGNVLVAAPPPPRAPGGTIKFKSAGGFDSLKNELCGFIDQDSEALQTIYQAGFSTEVGSLTFNLPRPLQVDDSSQSGTRDISKVYLLFFDVMVSATGAGDSFDRALGKRHMIARCFKCRPGTTGEDCDPKTQPAFSHTVTSVAIQLQPQEGNTCPWGEGNRLELSEQAMEKVQFLPNFAWGITGPTNCYLVANVQKSLEPTDPPNTNIFMDDEFLETLNAEISTGSEWKYLGRNKPSVFNNPMLYVEKEYTIENLGSKSEHSSLVIREGDSDMTPYWWLGKGITTLNKRITMTKSLMSHIQKYGFSTHSRLLKKVIDDVRTKRDDYHIHIMKNFVYQSEVLTDPTFKGLDFCQASIEAQDPSKFKTKGEIEKDPKLSRSYVGLAIADSVEMRFRQAISGQTTFEETWEDIWGMGVQ